MNIQPSSSNSPARGLQPASPARTKAYPAANPEVLVNGRLTSLNGALETIPAIRPDVVARGLALAADPNYPGPVVLDSLASTFADDALK